MVDWRDSESIEAWAKTISPKARSAFLTRLALRVTPIWASNRFLHERDLDLPLWRGLLAGAVQTIIVSNELAEAALVADRSCQDAARAFRDAQSDIFEHASRVHPSQLAPEAAEITSTYMSAATARPTVGKHSVSSSVSSALYTVSALESLSFGDDSYRLREELTSDADALRSVSPSDLLKLPLWSGPVSWLDHYEGRMAERWAAAPDVWSFWKEFYETLRDEDREPDWPLWRDVALIPDADWEKGPEHVAGEIRKIQDRIWEGRLPQHEKLRRSGATGRFDVEPEPFDEDIIVKSWLEQVEFAVELAADSNTSEFSRMCTAYKYIAHTLEKCRDDPNAIEQQFGIARRIIERNIRKTDYLADNSLHALAQVLEDVQLQMRADHPGVRKCWETRTEQRLREADEETRLAAAHAIRAETKRTEGRLSDQMELDAETVETSDSVEAQTAAIARAGGRAAKMNMLDRASEAAKEIDKSGGYKAVRIGTTGYTIGDIVWMLANLF